MPTLLSALLVVGCDSGDQSWLDTANGVEPQVATEPGDHSLGNESADINSPSKSSHISCPPTATTDTVNVSRVYDGDTLKLADGRKLRLVGVNTPELGHHGNIDEPYAMAAKKAAQQFVDEAEALQLQVGVDPEDNYGRTLGYLYNQKGQGLGAHLLTLGLAYHVAIPPNLSQANCLASLEAEARRQKISLWGKDGIPAVKAEQLKSGQGGFKRITGTITRISMPVGKPWYADVNKKLTVIVYPENQHRFQRGWFKDLKNQSVELQGWVSAKKGKWRLKLETPFGIDILH